MTGGGKYGHSGSTTETLVRDGGTAWKYAARLPTEIYGIKGIGFNGHFIVAGNPQSGIRVSFFRCDKHLYSRPCQSRNITTLLSSREGLTLWFFALNPNRRGLGVEKSLTFPAYK